MAEGAKRGIWGRIKLILLTILAVLVGIVVIQNTETTSLKFLAWEVNAPRVLLYPGLFAVGFLAGVLTLLMIQRGKRKEAMAAAKADAAVKEMEEGK